MARKKIETEVEVIKEEVVEVTPNTSEKERYDFLMKLYETLQNEGIRSISDLENKIANIKL